MRVVDEVEDLIADYLADHEGDVYSITATVLAEVLSRAGLLKPDRVPPTEAQIVQLRALQKKIDTEVREALDSKR